MPCLGIERQRGQRSARPEVGQRPWLGSLRAFRLVAQRSQLALRSDQRVVLGMRQSVLLLLVRRPRQRLLLQVRDRCVDQRPLREQVCSVLVDPLAHRRQVHRPRWLQRLRALLGAIQQHEARQLVEVAHLGFQLRCCSLCRSGLLLRLAASFRLRLRERGLLFSELLVVFRALRCDPRIAQRHGQARDRSGEHRSDAQRSRAMALHELAELIARGRRPRLHRLVRKMALDVRCERRGRRVSQLWLASHRALRDPIEVAAKAARPCGFWATALRSSAARNRRLRIAKPCAHLREVSLVAAEAHERGAPRDQLEQQRAERIHVRPRVDLAIERIELLGRHVRRRADERKSLGPAGRVHPVVIGRDGARDAEVDQLRRRSIDIAADEHVAWLDVAVHDALLMRVLCAKAHLDEQSQTLGQGQAALGAELRDRKPFDELHRKPRPPALGRPGLIDLGDRVMVHSRQRVAFALEALEDRSAVHAELQHLQRHFATQPIDADRAIDLAEATAANPLGRLIGTNALTRAIAVV